MADSQFQNIGGGADAIDLVAELSLEAGKNYRIDNLGEAWVYWRESDAAIADLSTITQGHPIPPKGTDYISVPNPVSRFYFFTRNTETRLAVIEVA